MNFGYVSVHPCRRCNPVLLITKVNTIMYYLGGVIQNVNVSLVELEEQGTILTQIRRELGTNREYLTRLHHNSTSVERLAAAPSIMPPVHEDDLGASAAAPPETGSLLGRSFFRRSMGHMGQNMGSVGDLIALGSVRSVHSRCPLPVGNSFASTRM